jgi:hypothetical protein
MLSDANTPIDVPGEIQLLIALISQAYADLRKQHEPNIRNAAIAFFRNETQILSIVCDLLDLDVSVVQRHVQRTYPDINL